MAFWRTDCVKPSNFIIWWGNPYHADREKQ